jgi:membrane-bound lytic murein transglycosylase MltF
MKRLIYLSVALLGTLLSISCGAGQPPEEAINSQPATGGQAALADIEEADPDQIEGESFVGDHLIRESWTGDLDGMVERRRIRALVVYSKTFYFYDMGQARGVTVEGLREFENVLNKKLKLGPDKHVNVIYIPVSRDRLIPGLEEGLGDIAASNLTITPERQKLVDFSIPVASGVKEIVVSGPGAPEVHQLSDLSGKEVYVRRSSSYYETLARFNSQLQSQGKPPVIIQEADENLEDEDILEMVNAGLVGLTIVDSHKATLWAEVFPSLRFQRDVAISEDNSIGWAFRKNSPKLEAAVNDFARAHRQGTAFGNTILRRYLQDTKWVRNATSEQEMAKRQAVIGLFQKYAAQYEFDWLMVAAQAYQESGLDQNAKSKVGAVGIMQVMPSTAESAPISMKEVDRNLENNVHAGVKILRHYRDQYFNDPELDEMNRTLLCFAAYNAGPNRINRLRQRAAKQGLNPNVWFRNVELVVAKSVGREPVQYVSNVYKYYIAYKLAAEAIARRAAVTQ